VGEHDESGTTDRAAMTTGDGRADDALLLVERLRDLRRRRRLGELTDEQLGAERLRLLERRTRSAPWHGVERRLPVTPEPVNLEGESADPFADLRRLAASKDGTASRHRAETLLDALERTRREGYQEINGVTLSRRAARYAERELGRRDQS
jgi:hypothetical protein